MKCPGGLSTVRCWSVASRGCEPRHYSRFRAELAINNQPSPINQSVTNLAVLNNGTNADIISTNIGSAFLAKTPELFSHDADGNLLLDGQWTNTWNGSPHEIALLPDTSRRRCGERPSPDTKQHFHLISRGRNRLVTVETTTAAVSAGAPRQKVEWSYLPDGRWSQRVVSLWSGGAWVAQSTNRFVWDGVVLLAVLSGNNQIEQTFMRGSDLSGTMNSAGGVSGLLAVNAGANGVHFAAFDGNGNVMGLVSADDGIETARYEYSPFGETLRATGPMALLNSLRFSTQFAEDDTGHVKYLYRGYNPESGRWLNTDPLGEVGEPNLHAFVKNNGISNWDYLGQSSSDDEWAEYLCSAIYPDWEHFSYKLLPQAPPKDAAACSKKILAAIAMAAKWLRSEPCKTAFTVFPNVGNDIDAFISKIDKHVILNGPGCTEMNLTCWDCKGSVNKTFPTTGYTRSKDGQYKVWICPASCEKSIAEIAKTLIHEWSHEASNGLGGELGAQAIANLCSQKR